MITHTNFCEYINRIFNKAILAKEIGQDIEAREIIGHAVQEINIHTRNTVTKPPRLLRLERDIFKFAFDLERKK